jgi:YVTN family beta-propeller protein
MAQSRAVGSPLPKTPRVDSMRYPKSFTPPPSYSIILALLIALMVGRWCWVVGPGAGRGPSQLPGGMSIELVSYQQANRVSLEGGVGWINSAPIHLQELKGKVVLLDFWTYCCINCHHVLPDLAYLEEKYKNELVVIGVHTAKFEAEKSTENIRKKVAEYRIKHPVINDANQVLWQRFGVQSWPTLVVLDANGRYAGATSGEGQREALDAFIGQLIAKERANGEINDTPFRFFPESEKPQNTSLLFPGKVCADEAGDRLFIADTGHNRIVITHLSGKVQKIVGNGSEGFVDGTFEKAEFNRPQGMCLVDDILYVADTENHAIRAIDLKSERVETAAGTGQQSQQRRGQGRAKTTGLNSPWDLVQIPGTRSLAVAMAGPHQIWKLDLDAGIVGWWAGSGLENIIDGPPAAAAFAQPSGLATDGKSIFVADSEVSGIRRLVLGRSGVDSVQTIVGVNLFGFGDVDGRGSSVRLQHCLGVAFDGGKLYIADSYNNKVKVCDPATRSVHSLVGTRAAGSSDDPPKFDEPGGLSSAGSTLYVADTNNHLIRAVDLKTQKVTTLAVDAKLPGSSPRPPSFPKATVVNVPATQVEPGREVPLDISLSLPAGFKLSPEAPMPYRIEAPDQPDALAAEAATNGGRIEPPSVAFALRIPMAQEATPGQTLNLKLSLAVFVCKESSGLCTVKNYVWNIPVTFAKGSKNQISLTNAPAKATLR